MYRESIARILDEVCIKRSVKKFSQSTNTFIAYNKGWNAFVEWCKENCLNPYEAKTHDVIRFLITKAITLREGNKQPLSLNTVRIYRSAINDRFRDADLISPASDVMVSSVLRGLAKTLGDIPRRVKAIREHQLRAMIQSCNDNLHGIRDAAVLSVGFAAALRRSEISSLHVEDVEFKGSEGVMLLVRQSKTDLQGTGQKIAIPNGKRIQPISRLNKWLKHSEVKSGFLFQTLRKGGIPSGNALDPGDVARIVKRYAKKVGLNPRDYAGHSLRSGFVTTAAAHRARIEKIMEVTRHRSFDTVMKYIRNEDLFFEHAGSEFL